MTEAEYTLLLVGIALASTWVIDRFEEIAAIVFDDARALVRASLDLARKLCEHRKHGKEVRKQDQG